MIIAGVASTKEIAQHDPGFAQILLVKDEMTQLKIQPLHS